MLVWPQRARRPIEHRIHELVAVGRAETLRESYAFIDDNSKGHLWPLFQLVGTDQQNGMLERIKAQRLALHPRRELDIESLACAATRCQDRAKVLHIGALHVGYGG